jgi:hypothetical protein
VASLIGWPLGLVGIVLLAVSLFQVQRDWFGVARSGEARLTPAARRLWLGAAALGLGLFIVAMIVGPHH